MTWDIGVAGAVITSNSLPQESSAQETFQSQVRKNNPDVLALQGLDGYTDERLMAKAAQWGHPYSVILKGPGSAIGLTSRRPIINCEKLTKGMGHGLLHCRTFGIDFFTVRLSADDLQMRRREAGLILFRIQNLTRSGGEAILLGDLNAVSPFDAALYQANASAVEPDYSVLATFMSAPMIDPCARHTGNPADRISLLVEGNGDPSQKTIGGRTFRRRIDYILATPKLADECVGCEIAAGGENRSPSGHSLIMVDFDH